MKKVLIVDDEEDILNVLKTYLARNGYDVRTTLTCDDGLEVFYNFKPDFVLLDVNVGKSDGSVMCKTIKGQSLFQNIPVILMSADRDNLSNYADCGATSVLEKPFTLPLFSQLLRHV